MLSLVIWGIGTSLEVLLLVRAIQAKLLQRFPLFYTYLFFVFVNDILRFATYRLYPDQYPWVYWITQFVGMVFGSAVIFEIYRVGLGRYPGAAKMTSYLLLIAFVGVLIKNLFNPATGVIGWVSAVLIDLERSLRIVQGVALAALIVLFLIYAIPFGRNLGGILFGYAFYITVCITQYTMWYYGLGNLTAVWGYIQSVAYLLVLVSWAYMLWSPDRAFEPEPTLQLENDYQMLANSTRQQVQRALSHLKGTAST
ncbi:MAG TPA: hypothetical protein VMH89_14310 [Candidatus Acidoferrum sp.]|nr:hypothetical protein [Candidatus Acidoferrum sp.]